MAAFNEFAFNSPGSVFGGARLSGPAPPPPPSTPSSFAAYVSSTTSITVWWTASSGATGYTVQESLTGTGGWSTAGSTTTATSLLVSGLTMGTTYFFRVYASNTTGDSGYSTIASAVPSVPPPSTPTNFAARVTSTTSITVSWTASSGATGYTVQESLTGTGGWSTAGSTTTATSLLVTGLTLGTRYFFRIYATNGTGNSDYSGAASAVPSSPSSGPASRRRWFAMLSPSARR